jgi:type I site-specific restriction endonuclease
MDEYLDLDAADGRHRSIYNEWRQVLKYFDESLIGLTGE